MPEPKQTRRILEMESRLVPLRDEPDDSFRCGHPRGPLACRRMCSCAQCPFAVLVELAPAA